ncbi:MAG: hypothetical protein K6A74_07645, partial [Lachnospiraceae bacterium]|nr:hypothetical protein [Lachnospiraceae bacterium]
EIILAGTAGEGESKALTKNKEFDLTVKTSNGKLLEYGVDYELEYLNNKSVGTATVIVKGIGSYSGTVTKTFKIKGTSVAKASLSAGIGTSSEYDVFYDEESKSFEYLGIPYEPAGPEDGSDDYGISLILGERKLVKGVDFTVSYSNNIKPGKASVTFTGMGGYTGSVTKNFKISAYDIGADTRGRIAINIASYSDYAKGGAKPEVTMTFRAEDGTVKELKVGEDFTVTCSNNKSMTTDMTNPAKAEIKGKGAFKGTVTGTFIINSKPLSDETIELSLKDVVYKNKAGICKTTVKLTDLDSKKALKAGKDYEKAFVYRYAEDTKDVFDKSLEGYVTREAGSEVTKDDIIPIGTKISVEITAKGNYTGTCEGTFRFVEKTLSKAIVTVADKTYLGGEGVTLDPEDLVVKFGKRGTPLTYGVDYVIDESTYKNNFKKGKATVVIKGISDRCGGTKKVTFKIKAKKMK